MKVSKIQLRQKNEELLLKFHKMNNVFASQLVLGTEGLRPKSNNHFFLHLPLGAQREHQTSVETQGARWIAKV